jgi:hypothetical protein
MLNKITTGKIQRAQKVFLYGVEKIGKSSLVAKFPAPIFLDVEKGTHHLALDRWDIKTADELYETITWAIRERHNYKTLVIDSADQAEKLMSNEVIKENHWKSIDEPGYGKGFTALAEKFQSFLDDLDLVISKGINVVLIGHAHIKRFNPPETLEGYDRWEPKLAPKDSEKAKAWADAVLFATFDIKVIGSDNKPKGIGGRERVIYTVRSAAYDAGNRLGLPEKIKMNIAALAPLFKAAEFEKPAFAPDKKTVLQAVFKGLDHAQLTTFLVNRKQLQSNQSIFDIPDEYAHRIALDPARFQRTVREFVEKDDPKTDDAEQTQTLQGVVEQTWTSEFEGTTYYFATVNGRQVQTTDHEVGEDLQSTGGLEIVATVKPSGKPNKFLLEAFKYPQVAETGVLE